MTKSSGRFCQIFEAFLENLNFTVIGFTKLVGINLLCRQKLSFFTLKQRHFWSNNFLFVIFCKKIDWSQFKIWNSGHVFMQNFDLSPSWDLNFCTRNVFMQNFDLSPSWDLNFSTRKHRAYKSKPENNHFRVWNLETWENWGP